jgi:SOS response associated peptidase (SRAP)
MACPPLSVRELSDPMCGRYASFLPAEAIARIFGKVSPLPNLAPSWNVAPTQGAAVVRRHPDTGGRHLDMLKRGLLPHWANQGAATDQCALGNGRQIRNVSRRAVTAALHRPSGCVLRVEGGRVRQAASRDRSTGRAADGVRQPVGELPAWQQPRSTMAWWFARCGRVAASRPQPSRIILSRDRGALRRDGAPSFRP